MTSILGSPETRELVEITAKKRSNVSLNVLIVGLSCNQQNTGTESERLIVDSPAVMILQ